MANLPAKSVIRGRLHIKESASNPVVGNISSLQGVQIYTKADKLVIAYNNAETMTYITIPLDGSTATWTHGTSAP